MNFYKLNESMKRQLIIVDVQPAYQKNINFNLPEFMKFITNYNSILFLFNGPDLGYENKDQIIEWYANYGFEDFYKMTFFEKGYGFFRDIMDQCWLREHIVKLIKYMIKKNINDIRKLEENDIKYLKIPDLAVRSLENYGFYIPELKDILPQWKGADICGGGFYECLDEVMLLSEAMRLNFKLIKQFTY